MIQEAISEKETNKEKNPVTEEVLQHALFCQRKGLACQGRDSFLSLVKRSLLENDSKRVSVLHGESGCGKTSIMAKIAVDIRKWLEPESAIVVLRFIGTSPESSNIRMLLRSISQQLYMITGNEITEIPEASWYIKIIDLWIYDLHNVRWIVRSTSLFWISAS